MIFGCNYIIEIVNKQRREVIILQTEVNYIQLGRRIREKRLEKGMKQQDMAVAVGTATNHLSDVERGRKKPSLELLMRISSLTDTPVDFFLMDNPHSCRSYCINEELAATLEQCSPQSLVVISNVAQSMITYQKSMGSREICPYDPTKGRVCPL